MKRAAIILLGSVLGLTGCAGGGEEPGAPAPAAEADIIKAACLKVGDQCIKNGMGAIPKSDSGKFTNDKCFHWNRSEETSRIDVEDKDAEFDKLFQKLGESRDKKQDDLTIMQLRLTLKYFQVEGNIDKMTVDQLFDEADDPVFTRWQLKGTDLKFTQVNIALGDNPMDVVFKEGTLDPLATAGDDSAIFCAPELKGK